MKKVISVSMVITMLFIFSACSSAEYTETPVTEVVTNENGETVTDAQGNAVTEVVTDESGNAKTETKKNTTTAKNNKNTTAAKNDGQNNDGNNSGNGSNSGSGNSGNNNSNTGDNSGNNGSNDNNTPTKDNDNPKPTEKPEKPKKRDVTINVVLPYYNGYDTNITLFYSVDGGEEIELETRALKLDKTNSPVEKFVIEDVKGEINAYIVFKNKDISITKNSVRVAATGDNSKEGTISPVTGIEIMDGGMD